MEGKKKIKNGKEGLQPVIGLYIEHYTLKWHNERTQSCILFSSEYQIICKDESYISTLECVIEY